MTETSDRLRLLFDWAAAQEGGRRLALWLFVAVLLHAGIYLIFRVTYPPPTSARISDAAFYVLLPHSEAARRLAPLLTSADPALFASEQSHGLEIPAPPIPAYQPSYAVATPQLETLPDPQARILPPLIRDFGAVPVPEAPTSMAPLPAPAEFTQVIFSAALQDRMPKKWPERHFTARPGDLLAPARFLLAVAPDGRVLQVFKDTDPSTRMLGTDNRQIDDAASQFLMKLWFRRDPDSRVSWGTATFHWGLDVKREELR